MYRISELEEIMETETIPLVRLTFYYVKDIHIAEEIVQKVFIKFFKQSKKYEERTTMSMHLKKMVANESRAYLKSWQHQKSRIHKKMDTIKNNPTSKYLFQKNQQSLIGEAILQLSIKQREAIIYYYFEELTITEIANFLSVSEKVVKVSIRQGKELLQSKIGLDWEVLLNE